MSRLAVRLCTSTLRDPLISLRSPQFVKVRRSRVALSGGPELRAANTVCSSSQLAALRSPQSSFDNVNETICVENGSTFATRCQYAWDVILWRRIALLSNPQCLQRRITVLASPQAKQSSQFANEALIKRAYKHVGAPLSKESALEINENHLLACVAEPKPKRTPSDERLSATQTPKSTRAPLRRSGRAARWPFAKDRLRGAGERSERLQRNARQCESAP